MVEAFNDHPHVIVSPNAKDMLQVKDADGNKVSVCKVLIQVGLGTILYECATTRMRESRGNTEEDREGIVSGPQGDH